MENTKYEVARLIGARALQLSSGAPPATKISKEEKTFLGVAEKELETKSIPLVVLREKDQK
jgi:DNA-directed RNA polymerase subunit K/omega